MTALSSRDLWIHATVVALTLLATWGARAAAPNNKTLVDFNRQVRPILSEHCFACHGPDQKTRKAKLRLDVKEGAFGPLRDGGVAIKPGKAAESELVARITATDPDIVMPPPKFRKRLTSEQIATLRRWIDEGAPWSEHWAFISPKRQPLPKVTDAKSPRNAIDHFILARLESEQLRPSPEADRATLIRRVTLDLTGLPPTLAEVAAFQADKSPEAFDKVVDRLLRSAAYGEHMARFWLDAARYGDTHGLHLDNFREMWPYRDWVIKAFSNNMPFDRFLVEQLAGDLLPDPTLDQIVATGFNRCHVSTSEGGSIEEEVYVRNVVDQVDTNGMVLLGLSTGCARCHDHKFDPIRMKDYYQLFAFFNNIDGKPMDGNVARHEPVAKVGTPEQTAALARLEKKVADVRKHIAATVAKVEYDDTADAREAKKPARGDFVWIDDDLPAGVKPQVDGGANLAWNFGDKSAVPPASGSRSVGLAKDGVGQLVFMDAKPGLKIGAGDVLFAHVYLDPSKPPREIMLQWHSSGWQHRAYWGDNVIAWGADNSGERLRMGPLPAAGKWVRLEVPAEKVGLKAGAVVNGWAFTLHGGAARWDRAGLVTETPQVDAAHRSLTAWQRAQRSADGAGLPRDIRTIVKLDAAKRNKSQNKQLRDYFLAHVYAPARPLFEPLLRELAKADKDRDRIDQTMPSTLVFRERKELRPAFMLNRGEYDKRGEQVARDTPAFLPPLPSDAPRNRLGFARWLVAPGHPLTARVAVNRFWQQVFGVGLVKTAEDFGSQGEPPSHRALLDWLAVQFVDDGWDVKKAMKRMVTSATYRQSSRVTPDRLARDPANRLLSRGPRFRLDAETLRDQALALGGLLIEHVGGPSVKPPQPAGLWEAVGYVTSNTAHFIPDAGRDKVHRRSLYTFWKRTAPPPQMNAFDAPSREACTVRRERTNTPLQALLLLNETQYVEAARALAERVFHEGGATPESRLTHLFRLSTARAPDARETSELLSAYKDHLAVYQRDSKAARELISLGESRPDTKLDPSELAAWTMIANTVLNLDEVLNKG